MIVNTRTAVKAVVLVFAMALGACTQPQPGETTAGGVFDPYENTNRGVHEFNRGVDRLLYRPASLGYSGLIPDPIEDSVSYFSENLSMPKNMVNGLLQGDLRTAGLALARFVINSTVGFAGLADPSTDFGIPRVDTDFGETLHVWGAREGAYVELPFFGPSNERDTVGMVVDLFLNPLSYVLPSPQDTYGIYAELAERLGDRGRFTDTIDSILYESADSYAQSRIIYIQNRRFELAGSGGETYLDPYAEVSGDPFDDPYEDPYAE